MNTNASISDRAFAVLLDLLTFFGFAGGVCMMIFSVNEINTEVSEALVSRGTLIKICIALVVAYFVLDILLTRIFATTPGKLCMNCDVDFHRGNSMIHNIIRSFFKVICLFTVIPAIFSYLSASADYDTRAYHDRIAKSNVTNTTRTPRALGIITVLVGLALLVFFIYKYHSVVGVTIDLGLPNYKIFDV